MASQQQQQQPAQGAGPWGLPLAEGTAKAKAKAPALGQSAADPTAGGAPPASLGQPASPPPGPGAAAAAAAAPAQPPAPTLAGDAAPPMGPAQAWLGVASGEAGAPGGGAGSLGFPAGGQAGGLGLPANPEDLSAEMHQFLWQMASQRPWPSDKVLAEWVCPTCKSAGPFCPEPKSVWAKGRRYHPVTVWVPDNLDPARLFGRDHRIPALPTGIPSGPISPQTLRLDWRRRGLDGRPEADHEDNPLASAQQATSRKRRDHSRSQLARDWGHLSPGQKAGGGAPRAGPPKVG